MQGVRKFLEAGLNHVLERQISVDHVSIQNGGYINTSALVNTSGGRFFVKWNEADLINMFEQEARGLQLLGATDTIKTPEVYGFGKAGDSSLLVLEVVERGTTGQNYWTDMGERLAAMHSLSQEAFGLDHDNYIGRLTQSNSSEKDWLTFYTEQRLRYQLDMAISKGLVPPGFVQRFNRFLDRLNTILPYSEPSILHGDLWNGNVMPGANGETYFFDPAVYCGAREMDLAMTCLFGGFDPRFYKAYHSVYPLPDSFEDLMDVYNLYPLMVHVNLFGPGSEYLDSADRIIRRYL